MIFDPDARLAQAKAEQAAMIARGKASADAFRERERVRYETTGADAPSLFDRPAAYKPAPRLPSSQVNLAELEGILERAEADLQPPVPAPPARPAEGVRTSLDAGATTVEEGIAPYLRDSLACHVDRPAQDFRFRNVRELRSLYVKHVIPNEKTYKRAKRMVDCGSSGTLYYDRNGRRMLMTPITCGVRTCPACCDRHRARIERIMGEMLGTPKPNEWRFITLTLRSSRAPLAQQLDWLTASFRRLRQTTLWKQTQDSGRGVIEITWNANTQEWHPHLHIVGRGQFLAQPALSAVWRRCTQGSHIVDIRAIGSSKELSCYVSKYVGKPPELAGAEDAGARLLEWHRSLEGRRMVITYGKLPKLELSEDLENDDEIPPDAIPVGNIADIAADARAGDPWALWVMACLMNGGPPPYPEPDRRPRLPGQPPPPKLTQ